MINVPQVKKLCTDATYARGIRLYSKGFIMKMQCEVENTLGNDTTHIVAKVHGSGNNSYRIELCINEAMGSVDDGNCTCPAFYERDGLCKHCIAVLLEYIKRRNIKATAGSSSYGQAVVPIRKTSQGLSKIISYYRNKERLALIQPNDEILIKPTVNIGFGSANVEFKIGNKNMYVLKNIASFVESVNTMSWVSYGKKLEFYHTMEAFSEKSRLFVDFMIQEIRKKKETDQSYWYYRANDNRYLSLNSSNLDEFFEAVGGQEFLAKTDKGDMEFRLAEGGFAQNIVLIGDDSGLMLEIPRTQMMYGRKYAYLWAEGVVYKESMSKVGELEQFFRMLADFKYEDFFVSKSELPIFCREILPILKCHYTIEQKNFEESMYLPQKAEYEIYLDTEDNDKNIIMCKLFAVYQDEKYDVYAKNGREERRDKMDEMRMGKLVGDFFNAYDPDKNAMVMIQDDDKLFTLLSVGIPKLQEEATVFISDSIKGMSVKRSSPVSIGVSLKGDLLELSLSSGEMPQNQLIEILTKYNRKKKYHRLKDGTFISFEDGDFDTIYNVKNSLMITDSQLKSGSVVVPKYRALYLDAELKGGNRGHVAKNKEFKSLIRNMKTVEDNDFEIPKALEHVLRDYQKQGFLWMKTLKQNGFGGILADDMGLGKTIQAIAFLQDEIEEFHNSNDNALRNGSSLQNSGAQANEDSLQKNNRESMENTKNEGSHFALIICPASLVYNWKNEIERFAPSLKTGMVTGNATQRREMLENCGADAILITSYHLLKRDSQYYEGKSFRCQIVDEAQYIKNHATQTFKAVKNIRSGFKLALTGTPIENRLSELWSIFDYLMPGFLYSYKRFREDLEVPIVQDNDEEELIRLQKMIHPFILRRLKKDVLKELPDKLEESVYAILEGEQERLYTAHVQMIRKMLDNQTDEEFSTSKIQILAELTKLRQLCCDPSLLYSDYDKESAKMTICLELVKQAVDGGHKVLIFSQFTTMLAHIEEHLAKEKMAYYSLTGATKKEKRAQMVEAFAYNDVAVFCISLKAGGTGLNLTAADIVIHYDPWWNVAVQNQATGRVHRIGQKNVVTVYKLIMKNTIEENIVKLQDKKSELADQLLSGDGIGSVQFSRKELLELLSKSS
ncbi:SNF2 helicase associated domain-containing protein [Lachnospiraceae bacterium ZAX-1]